MITFKRIRRRGKYYIIARDQKGRIRSSRKWKRSFTLRSASKKYSKDRILRKGTRQIILTNFREIITDRMVKPKRYRAGVQASILLDNRKIVARSMFTSRKSIKSLASEARENLFLRVSQEFEGAYDEEIGKQIAGNRPIDFKVVYYAPKAY